MGDARRSNLNWSGCVVWLSLILAALGPSASAQDRYEGTKQRIAVLPSFSAGSAGGERLWLSRSRSMKTGRAGSETYKMFQWTGPIRAGKCTLYGGRLVLYSNGYADFRANPLFSRGSNDAWLATFTVQDRNGVNLYTFPRIASPTIINGMSWWQCCLYFPEYVYPYIARANMRSHC
jgi:hypothetical protein